MTSVLDEIEKIAGWEDLPLRAVGVKVSESGFPNLESLSVFLDSGVVPRSSREDNHNQLGESLEKYQRVLPKDLVFNKLRTWQGGFGISDYEGIVSPAYIVVRLNTEVIYPKFLGYLLKSEHYLAELTRLSKWMPPSQFDISWESLRDLSLRVPTIKKQQIISDYLDDKIGKIDELIHVKNKQIELLQELEISYITGLYSSQNLIPIKHYCINGGQYGLNVEASEYSSSGTRLLRTSDFGTREIEPIYLNFPIPDKHLVLSGDILFSRSGSVGESFYVDSELEGSTFAGFLVRFRVNPNVCLSKFLYYATKSKTFKSQIEMGSITSTISNFNGDKYEDILIPNKSLAEQVKIVGLLEGFLPNLQKEIEMLRQSIKIQYEYKNALIASLISGSNEIIPIKEKVS